MVAWSDLTTRYSTAFVVPATLLVVSLLAESAAAQVIGAPLTRGFVATSGIDMSVDEMLGNQKSREVGQDIIGPGYPDLWIHEIQFKPIRYVRMNVVDPKTREVSRELVWYMVYRLIPRDYTELAGNSQDALLAKLNDPNTAPANDIDAVRAASLQIPRFVLQTNDQGSEQTYVDEVNLEIQRRVFQREFREEVSGLPLLNSVEAITEIPEPVSTADPAPLAKAIYGVAVWRNVDPETDFLTVYMTGLSNAYRITMAADSGMTVQEKVVVQKFGRPGDRFLQDEAEFVQVKEEDLDRDGIPDVRFPHWEYRNRPADLSVPELESILRNTRSADAGSEVN